MRQITPGLPPDLESAFGRDVARADPVKVNTYRELVRHTARVAHANPEHLLFFRGQGVDYTNKGGSSSFYPSIYRTDPLPGSEIQSRFERLRFQGQQLANAFKEQGLPGAEELAARELLQWSVIQHYEVGLTPLLDMTHSLMVACSFAQDQAESSNAFVFLFGFPHIANRISVNSEHDIINIRLLSICPPDALRPYFQEGYLVGTWDVTDGYSDKTVLDFNRRLVAKFKIPSDSEFWGDGFDRVPRELLYPADDQVKVLCENIKEAAERSVGPRDLGLFLLAWQDIERALLSAAGSRTGQMTNVRRAIDLLVQEEVISLFLAEELADLRTARNKVVHEALWLGPDEIETLVGRAREIAEMLEGELDRRGYVD